MKTRPNPVLTDTDGFGLRLSAQLDAAELPPGMAQRLRAARQQALDQHRALARSRAWQRQWTPAWAGVGSATPSHWYGRITAIVAALALLLGLVGVDLLQTQSRARELAEIDAALLTDDLPPAAYTDAGFAQFIKLHAGGAPQ